MLLHRGVRHHQLPGDLADRGRLGEHVARQHRPAQAQQDVALPAGELGRGLGRLRLLAVVGPVVGVEHQPGLADADLVAVAQRARAHDPVPVDERAVAGREVAGRPTGREPLQGGVEARQGRVRRHRDVVAPGFADGDPVRVENHEPPPGRVPDLQVLGHVLTRR